MNDALQQMRSAGIYLIQSEIGSARSAVFPQGEILITFRVGRSFASVSFQNPNNIKGELAFNSLIQLNVDSTALQAQRCSLTFTEKDKHVVGIALISLPKDKNLIQSTFRLTQNEDKRAEVDVKIKISPLDGSIPTISKVASQQVKSQSSILRTESLKHNESKPNPDNLLPKIYVNNLLKTQSFTSNPQSSSNNGPSKISEEYSHAQSGDRKPKGFKMRQDDRVVHLNESDLKRYKEEKQVYYQLYQIQKGKNEIASKFISNLLKKITEKYPSLAQIITEQSYESNKPIELTSGDKKSTKNLHHQQQEMIAQLEQANRSLHRQVQQYKKLIEQMKIDIVKPSKDLVSEAKYTANLILPSLLDLSGSKSTVRQKSRIKSAVNIREKEHIKQQKTKNQLKEVDFSKWLNLSIGQRQAIQTLLGNIAQKTATNDAVQKKEAYLKKLKTKLDKAFTILLSKKQITKDALLSHKKQVNKFFEEVINY